MVPFNSVLAIALLVLKELLKAAFAVEPLLASGIAIPIQILAFSAVIVAVVVGDIVDSHVNRQRRIRLSATTVLLHSAHAGVTL